MQLKTVRFSLDDKGIHFDGKPIKFYNLCIPKGIYTALCRPICNKMYDALYYWKHDEEHHTFGNLCS